MTPKEAIKYINTHTWSQWKLGLERTEELLRRLGDPQKKLRFIHVAGSNGKGSTCAMLERILREAGYRTGMYPSPYIEDFRERIQVNGEWITEDALCELTERVKREADEMEDHPSQFELITAIGMLYFAACRCDIVVLEVGLGGTYDSTNVIDPPEVAVIANIGLEHTEYLGTTLAEIAGNKGGIIKTGSDVVLYENVDEVTDVIRAICEEKGCDLTISSADRLTLIRRDLTGQTFSVRGREGEPDRVYNLALIGDYQINNAATVCTVVDVLRRRGFDIPEEAVKAGFENVRWPARFEVLSREPLFILDGGHNGQCAEALTRSLDVYLPGETITFIIGLLGDKDRERMFELLKPYGGEYFCVTSPSPRAITAEDLAAELRSRGEKASAYGTAEEAVAEALKTGRPVVAFGSLYLAGEIRKNYLRPLKTFQRRIAYQRRKALTAEEKAEKSAAICAYLMELPAVREAGTIFSYMATPQEADLTLFNEWARERGIRLAYPISKEGGKMLAAVPADEDGWETGAYNITSPIEEKAQILEPDEIDVVLVPCVAFDENGSRMGHGAGYYDRFLARGRNGRPAPVLIAFEAQKLTEIAVGATDIPMPVIVTEEGVRRIR